MEIRLNLATCSLKDAEHAIFIIGAYFGMTALPTVAATPVAAAAATVGAPGMVRPFGSQPEPQAAHVVIPPVVPVDPTLGAEPQAVGYVNPDADPVATFAANPPALPPGAGEAPDTSNPAAVFAGNGATVPAGALASPVAGPSATPAAAVAVGEAGNGAGTAAAPVGSSPSPAPAAGASVPPAGVELDTTGLPWDARIHSLAEGGGHPKTDKGVWRKKRNVQPMEVAQVEAELRALLALGTGGVVIPPAPPAAQVPTPPPVDPVHTHSIPSMHTVSPCTPVPSPSADPTTFAQLMPRVTNAVVAGKLPQTALAEAVKAYELPNIPALAHRPDLVPYVWAFLTQTYGLV